MRRWHVSSLCTGLLLLQAAAAWAGVFDEWSDEGSEGSFSSESAVESSFTSSESSNGSHIADERSSCADKDGNRSEYHSRETTHPDGTVTQEQETSYTDSFGKQTTERTTRQYDAQGNLVDETYADGSSEQGPRPPGEGVESQETINPGQSDPYTQTTTYGGDNIKIEQSKPQSPELIFDLPNEIMHIIDRLSGKDTSESMYFCKEFDQSMAEQYGSRENMVNQAVAPAISAMEQLKQLPQFQGQTEQIQKQIDTIKQNQRQMDQINPEHFTYTITQERKMISGLLAEKVEVRNGNDLIKEIWFSKTLNVLGVMNRAHIPQKAKDAFFAPPAPTPELRRIYGRLKLSEITYPPLDKQVKRAMKVKRVKLGPNVFAIPK